jgi:hypothetical protein
LPPPSASPRPPSAATSPISTPSSPSSSSATSAPSSAPAATPPKACRSTTQTGTRCSAAYVAFTRNAFSGSTPDHTLLIRERHTLPPDLLEPIEHLRELIGSNLGKVCPEATLSLLDNPFIQPPQIEATLAALQDPSAEQPKIKNITYPKHTRPTEKQPANAAFPRPRRKPAPARSLRPPKPPTHQTLTNRA